MSAQVEAFRAAAKVLDESELRWWLSDGSVLGAVREDRLLPWDPDVDLGVWHADMPAVREAFTTAGWPLKRDRPGQVWAVHGGVKVDLHGHIRDGDRVWYELSRGRLAYQFEASLFNTFAWTALHGAQARMPCPPEDYLAAHYGESWRTPVSRWRWDRDPPCLTTGPGR